MKIRMGFFMMKLIRLQKAGRQNKRKNKKNQRIYLDMIDYHINLNIKIKRKKMMVIKNMKKKK